MFVESGLPTEAVVGIMELEPLGVTPVVTFVDENVDGADMTCVCRRGNLSAYYTITRHPDIIKSISLAISKMKKFIPGAALTAVGIAHLLRY